jgi:hypothetical protein
VLNAGLSWVKLKCHEWKCLRGFTVRDLFNQTNKQTNHHKGLLGCLLLYILTGESPGGFHAESRTILGKAQAPQVETSQGFYCSGFIQPNKQTNKQKLKQHEWRLRGFTVRVLFHQTNKQPNSKP